jgi:hypothetical protein
VPAPPPLRGRTAEPAAREALAGRTATWPWKAPPSITGTLRFCIRSFDRAGNGSTTSCAALRITR